MLQNLYIFLLDLKFIRRTCTRCAVYVGVHEVRKPEAMGVSLRIERGNWFGRAGVEIKTTTETKRATDSFAHFVGRRRPRTRRRIRMTRLSGRSWGK